MSTKYTTGYIEKAASTTDYAGRFVLNEETPDRVGDVIAVKGWVLDQFVKNPVALWMHKHDQPIGTWENVQVKGRQLIGDLRLSGIPLAQMAKQLIDEGILKAVSVGFRVLDYDPIDKEDPWGAWNIKSAELLETSLVSVGAHPNALRISKSLGLSREDRELIFGAGTPAVQIDPDVREKATHPAVIRATQILAEARKSLGDHA